MSKKSFIKLKKKERYYVAVLLFVAVATCYYRGFYAPRTEDIEYLVEELETAEIEKVSIEMDIPDLTQSKEELERKNALYTTKLEELSIEEEQILASSEVTTLLETFTRLSEDLDMEVVYVRSKKQETKSKDSSYRDFIIEMSYISSFPVSVKYTKRLEKISDYLKIDDAMMTIEKEQETPRTYLVLSTKISDENKSREKAVGKDVPDSKKFIREGKEDPFTTSEKPYDKMIFMETGISSLMRSEGKAAAIIDGKIWKIGDIMMDREIVDIMLNKIIVKEGSRLYEIVPGSQKGDK